MTASWQRAPNGQPTTNALNRLVNESPTVVITLKVKLVWGSQGNHEGNDVPATGQSRTKPRREVRSSLLPTVTSQVAGCNVYVHFPSQTEMALRWSYFQNFFSKFCEPRLKIFLTILVPGTKIEKRHLRICGSGLLEIRERKDVIVNDSRKPHQRNCQSSFWDAHRTTFSIRFMFTTNKQHKSPKFVSIANARFFTFSEDCANWSLFKHRSCVHKTGNK